MLPLSRLGGEPNERGLCPVRELVHEEYARLVTRNEVIQRLIVSVSNYFPQFAEESKRELRYIANEAYELADQTYGIAEAVRWADGFKIPVAAVEEDVERLRAAGGCVTTMARQARELRKEI